jgi:uncharacterized protein (DUF1015 family)
VLGVSELEAIVRIETNIEYIIKGIDEIMAVVNNSNYKGCATD